MPDSIRLGYELSVRRLTQVEKEAMIQANKKFMMCFGVKAPYDNWAEYERYYSTMLRSKKLLQPSEACYDIMAGLSYSTNPISKLFNDVMMWITMMMMPQRLCQQLYGRKMTRTDYFLFALIVARVRFVYRFIPAWLRYLPQYHFMARRAGRKEHWAVTDKVIDGIDAFTDWFLKVFLGERPKEAVEATLDEARRKRHAATMAGRA